MISVLGTLALVAATGLGAAASLAWGYGARQGPTSRTNRIARLCITGTWLASAAAVALMEWALLAADTSVRYVAETGGRDLPVFAKITALWAGAGGSLLLWLFVLASCAAQFARRRSVPAAVGPPVHATANAVLAAILAAFALATTVFLAPFARSEVTPADGPGPNPLLQDHLAMGVHPPLLYAGFACLAVPFALAVGALLVGRVDTPWARVTRAWTLPAWMFLSAAIALGAWWAYSVLGWGGYWAWDPVENVSLMPWLVATALLHIVRSPGRSPGWAASAASLAGAAFLLVLLGTLLTRSGAVLSVHSFSDSPLGIPLLALFAVVLVGWTALLIDRRDRLGADDGRVVESALLSRQTALRAQTVLLALITTVVFLGTVLPVLVEALTGDQLSVGAPWFNRTAGPLALALLVIMALGPLVGWHRDDAHLLLHRLTWPGIAALATLGVVGLAGPGGVYFPLVSAVAAFVVVTLARESVARRFAAHRGATPSKRRIGALVAHTGIAIAAVAVVGTSYGSSDQDTIGVGETFTSGEVSATLLGVDRWDEGRRSVTSARVLLGEHGDPLGAVRPELHFYPAHSMVVADPAAWTGGTSEVQVSLVNVDPEAGTAALRVSVTPMLWWLWSAAAIIVLGGMIAALPPTSARLGHRSTPDNVPARRTAPAEASR